MAAAADEALAIQDLNQMWQWTCPYPTPFPELEDAAWRRCAFGVPWNKAAKRAVLWGDSHAEHMAPIVEAAAKDFPDAFLLYTPCSAALGGSVHRDPDPRLPNYLELCTNVRVRGLQLLKNHPEIDLVILASAWRGIANLITPPGNRPGGPEAIALMSKGIREFLGEAATPGRRFIIIADVPQVPVDPVSCAIADRSGLLRRTCASGGGLTREEFQRWHGPVNNALAAIGAERVDTVTVLPSQAFCAGEVCRTQIDGEVVYRDGTHIRRNLSDSKKRELADLFGLTAAIREVNQKIRVACRATRASKDGTRGCPDSRLLSPPP